MLPTTQTKIGFMSTSAPSSRHLENFKTFIPRNIDFTFVQETNPGTSLWDAKGRADVLIKQAIDLVAKYSWNGIIISGAPKEALNPGLFDRLSNALKVPVAMALQSSVSALKAFSAKRVLLMTPVDDELKKLYCKYLAGFGIDAVYPPQTLRAHTDAQQLTPDDVMLMTTRAFAEQSGLDAIYFQGALLDPIPVLERLEQELDVPVVASNPAMLWFALSKLGLNYNISGFGRLLSLWPYVSDN